MCALAKPTYASNSDVIFDEKIGIWPFINQEPAKRSSKNRKKGELKTKPIQSITKEHMRIVLINNVNQIITAN